MPIGTIKKVTERGFGFITIEGGADLFFHASGMAEHGSFDNLQIGDRVKFDLDESGERPRAINVAPR